MRNFLFLFLFPLAALFAEENPLLSKIDLTLDGASEPVLSEILEAKFATRTLDLELISEIRREIQSYFEAKGTPFVAIDIPEQEITQGELKISLSSSTLCGVECQGNRYFPCKTLERYVRLKDGEPICTETLLSDLAFINRNPFRKINALFLPGDAENTTRVSLVAKDRLPLRLYAGGDNTGNKYTGNARWFAGTNFSNPWLDHLISYQYTTSSDVSEFQSHTLHLLMPLPIRQTLIFYGGLSYVKPSLSRFRNETEPPATRFRSGSSNAQASCRYEIPVFKTWDGYLHQFTFGFDWKHLNNDLEYIGDSTLPIFFKTLNLSQFLAGYTYALQTDKSRFTLDAELVFSPFSMFSHSSHSDFSHFRAGANNQYVYGRIGVRETYSLPRGFSFYGYFRGQGASSALIPSEQLGLGGYDTVRGYDERIFDADNALIANLELHTPSLFSKYQTYFLLFGDAAGGWNFDSLVGERKVDWLASAGAGFRCFLDRYIQARADYGFKLHKDTVIGSSLGKLHVGLIASY